MAAVALALAMLPGPRAQAQDLDPDLMRAAADVALAYVVTGDARIDQASEQGLTGLSQALRSRTSVEPADPVGDAWTHRENDDTYHRIDYMLASEGLMPEVIPEKSYVVRSPMLLRASDHRPLVAIFSAAERSPDAAPDLSKRLPPEIPQND